MRVVVTGLGVLSSAGVGHDAFWRRLVAGDVCTRAAQGMDLRDLTSDRAGQVEGPLPGVSEMRLRVSASGTELGVLERSTELAMAAAHLAVTDARLSRDDVSILAERAGICMGEVVANRPSLEAYVSTLSRGQSDAVPGRFERQYASEMVARAPAHALGLGGPVLTLSNACAAGNWAIAHAADLIASGRVDVMLAGGADELSPAMFVMFSQHNALSPDVVRPFDVSRKGLILAEGACVLVLEREDHARSRAARIYGYVGGHGAISDAHDMMHPHPEGFGAVHSMRLAIEDAGLRPTDIDYVSAHGTGTPVNDVIEARAVRSLFRSHADALPVSSIKSMIGHAQGAASALEAATCLLAMRDDLVPPTVNHDRTDPGCELDVVPNRARQKGVRACVNNAFGFGGNVCCVVFQRS